MEMVIQILVLFIIINSLLKLSFWKWWQTVIFAAITAVFVIWAQQYAIVQSKTQLQDYLLNRRALQDMAVLVTVESAICFAFCFAMLTDMFEKKRKLRIRFLHWYPNLLLFPVLFYLLTQAVFSFPGINFDTITYVFAGITFVAIPAASIGMKLLVREKELLLEVHFLVSLFIAILGLLTTVNGNVVYAAVKEPLDIKAITGAVIIFMLFFAVGFIWNRVKWRFGKKYRSNSKT